MTEAADLKRKPLPTIGVDKYTFIKVTEDNKQGTTYDTKAYTFPGTVEIAPSDTGGNAVFDADNGAYEAVSYVEKIGHEITNADITAEVEELWRGLAPGKSGVLEVGSDMKTVYFGVAWRIMKSDGTYRYFRAYKGSYSFASNVGGKTKPSDGAPEFQTAKATYTSVQRTSDGKYYAYMDESDFPAGVTREAFESNWFTDLNYYPAEEGQQ